MIYSVEVTNHKDESILLELSNPWDSGIAISNIDGIGGAQADINTTDMAVMDGSWYNSSRAQARNITITLKPMRPDVEANRHKIYKYFPVKRQVTLRFMTDERYVSISGYVESVNTSIFSEMEASQVSILCPDPYFRAGVTSEETFSGIRPLFEFPFSCENLELIGNRDEWYSNIVPNFDFTGIETVNSWHQTGATIDGWTVTGHYGNFEVSVLKEEAIQIRHYKSSNEVTVWSTTIKMVRGRTVTISALTNDGVFYKTYSLPASGTVSWTDLSLGHNFSLRFILQDGSADATFSVYHPAATDDDVIQIRAVKAEYASKQTLAKQDGGKWVIIQQPPDSDYKEGPGDIEFGRINLDTRADLYYDGDADTGIIATVRIKSQVNTVTINSITNNTNMTIDAVKIASITGITVDDGDDIIINTTLGQRSARLLHSGEYFNIIGAIVRGADWFQLTPGDNMFSFTSLPDDADVELGIEYTKTYGGI